MRILWWSNGPWVPSGYGVQTRLFLPRLRDLGHELAVCTNSGLHSGTIVWEGFRILAAGGTAGSEVIGLHSQHWEADITVSLLDAWAINPSAFRNSGMRWLPWFPVDSDPIQPAVVGAVKHAFDSIVFSKFGERIAQRSGLTPYYVPHGVDTCVYSPIDRKEARKALGCPPDAFLLGMVAMNRGYLSRKSIPQVLQAFAVFVSKRPDALLYLHMPSGEEPWAEKIAMQLGPLVDHLGIRRHIVMAEEYNLLVGYSDAYMNNVYNALDGLVAPSMGEGFGVPILEAQASGCPVLVGDWTSMSELCFAGLAIEKSRAEFMWTELHGGQMLPHVAAIVDGMEFLYQRRDDSPLREKARDCALAYDAERIAQDYWRPTLASIEAKIRGQPPRNRKAELLLETLEKAPPGAVAEVGCLRVRREIPSDGHSTLYFARACLASGRTFTSVDRDPAAVDTANRVLVEAGLPGLVVVGEGAQFLRDAGPLAMAYLDSSDDPQDTLEQFSSAEILPGGWIVVDDAQATGQNILGKATLVARHCGKRGVPFEIVSTEPGFGAMVVCLPDGKASLQLP